MDYVRFGRTGLRVSRFCLGTMGFGTSKWKGWVLDEDRTVPILKEALDLGINFFDMADWYSQGVNEQVVAGNLLKMTQRDRLVLATKVFYPMSDDPNDQGLSRKHILASIDRSLKAMGTDYVDIYMIHAFDPNVPFEETMEALDSVVRSGKARYLASSTQYSWQFAEMNAVAARNGWHQFVNMQCQYNLLYREEEREMIPYCRHKGIAVSTFSPLARGFLTGAQNTSRTAHDIYLNFYGDAIDVEIARRVAELAEKRGVTPGEIAMSYVVHSPHVDVSLIGADTPDQVRIAVRATELVLSAEERTHLEAPYRPRDMINDYNEIRRPRAFAPDAA
jgi:aryl-alcohol dehydrogenase-like predicted oxidoreductase